MRGPLNPATTQTRPAPAAIANPMRAQPKRVAVLEWSLRQRQQSQPPRPTTNAARLASPSTDWRADN